MDFKRSAPYSESDEVVISWITGNNSDQAQLSRNRVENDIANVTRLLLFAERFDAQKRTVNCAAIK
jgi:hypothetical protein